MDGDATLTGGMGIRRTTFHTAQVITIAVTPTRNPVPPAGGKRQDKPALPANARIETIVFC